MNAGPAPGIRPIPLLVAAVAWSWLWWAASIGLGGMETTFGGITWLVGGLGPAIAVVVAYRRSGPDYRRSFRHRLLRWRISWHVLTAAVLFIAGPKLLALALAALGGHATTGEAIAVAALPLSLVFGVVVVWIEEPLWRGVALDGFGAARTKASLVIGVAWSVWHMPLFLIDGTWQHGLGLLTLDFWFFSIGAVALSVIFTWFVVAGGGSILLPLGAHLLLNMTGEYLPDDTTVRGLEMVILLLIAAVLFYRLRLGEAGSVGAAAGAANPPAQEPGSRAR